MDRKWADSLREKLHWKKKNKTENAQESGDGQSRTPAEVLARFIIEKRALIESVFVAGCIFSIIAMCFVNVNYDLTKYVPSYTQSSQGLDKMKEEFGYPGTARLMIKDVSLYEAKMYKDQLAAVDGVDQILWCDTTVNVYAGEDFVNLDDIKDYYKDGCAVMDITFEEESDSPMDQILWCDTTVNVYAGEDFVNLDDIKDYYKDGCAVMDITFEEESDSPRTERAIDEMKAITGDKGCYVGMAVQNKSLIETTAREMGRILVVAVLMILAVLCLATTAWTEPILFMMVMGVAVLLNKGTNIFLGTISFLTDNVAIILQLATSMDYSIFLLDAFMSWRDTGLSEEEAIVKAVEEAINSIFASSLTTVVGFLAYKDGCAVMDITFEEESDSPKTERAIDEMKAITGDNGCYVGMAVQNKSLIETTAREMGRTLVVAVLMILAVLCLATTAWTEPILFMMVMGVAVLLNKGTNIFL